MSSDARFVDFEQRPQFEPQGVIEGNRSHDNGVAGYLGMDGEETAFVTYRDRIGDGLILTETVIKRMTMKGVDTVYAVVGNDVYEFDSYEYRRAMAGTNEGVEVRQLGTHRATHWPNIANRFPQP